MSENVGFGLRYSMFRTENQTDNIYVYNNVTGYSSTGMLKDDISIQYIGPTLCTRISSANRKTHFVSGFSMGYLSYKNNATVISNFQLTSGALGLWWDLGLDLQLDRNLILGLSLSYTMGILRYYDYKDETTSRTINLEKDSFENISRIDVSVALKWNR